jgi:acetyl-CoA carboxylase biotin carboxyl carrier protein
MGVIRDFWASQKSPKKILTNEGTLRLNHYRDRVSCFRAGVLRHASVGHAYPKKEERFMATPVTVPMVGKIVSVSVKVGDRVEENDQVAVLEAMKMEMPLVAPVGGMVKEVLVKAGQEVEAEATVAIID